MLRLNKNSSNLQFYCHYVKVQYIHLCIVYLSTDFNLKIVTLTIRKITCGSYGASVTVYVK